LAWIYLLVAGFFEIGWAVGLKYSDGFSKLIPSMLTILSMIISFVFLAQAVRTIPIGTGYAIWTGIGAMGTAILGIILFGEPYGIARLGCLVLVFAGIIGLKLTAAH
jgi:quaternary ammonium compound-resistance protein SugE